VCSPRRREQTRARHAGLRAGQGDARWREQARLERKADKTLQKVQARHHPASDSDDKRGGVEPAGEAYITLRFRPPQERRLDEPARPGDWP
jgi:hypothetical protein